ncbi:MAG TPA: class I SAM-dependent methyltransferase [Bacteroidales bacterium]|nr:class I SAM-dependent methyltransferase [Bacteroidales bacterium]
MSIRLKFVKEYKKFCDKYPGFRKLSRKFMYSLFAYLVRATHWKFMNYGYDEPAGTWMHPSLNEDDEDNRYSIQLYHHLAVNVSLDKKKVLEVGCGRGGGASYLGRYFNPYKIVGLDYCGKAISFCKKNYKENNLSFVRGDAESLPFDDHSFDLVFNVESSHCYGSFTRFVQQVARVLNPGGYFLITDFREPEKIEGFIDSLKDSGLNLISNRDISDNVLSALDSHNEKKLMIISKNVPPWLRGLMREFAGVQGSNLYKKFRSDKMKYLSIVLQKQPV